MWQERVDQIVGIKIDHRPEGIFLSQPHLTRSLLVEQGFEMSAATTPMVAGLHLETAPTGSLAVEASKYLSVIGSLSYLAVGTRPDIAFSVNFLARFSACPQKDHWTALKHLLRYLSSTRNEGLWFKYGDVNSTLDVYCDANWGGEGSRSTHGYMIFLYGCLIGWASRRQSCVATSTCHAEYMALGTSTREVVWVINVLEDILKEKMKANLLCDNTAAVKVATDLHLTKRSHNVAREFHYVNEQIFDGNVSVTWIDTTQQRADILTKALGHQLFDIFKQLAGMGKGV